MIHIASRLGIGFDIEHNETNIYRVGTIEDEELLLGFIGLIIRLPFFTIHIGDFIELPNYRRTGPIND